MIRNYTEAVRNGFFDLAEANIPEIWKELDRSADMLASGQWKAHFQEVISKYRFSSRFAIMRILFEKATGLTPASTDDQALEKGFSVAGIGNFPNITLKHAEQLSPQEIAAYRKLLLRRVKEKDPAHAQEAARLIDQALTLPAPGQKSALCREALIRLGHMVDFSLEDMQFLLLRSLGDNEAGFLYSASGDLIDMYGFITHTGLTEIDSLKSWYLKNAAKLPKVDYADKPIHCTQDIAESIEQVFGRWQPEERDDQFRLWLCQQAPYLDIKSKSARKLYVNLAAYACIRASHAPISDMSEFVDINFYSDMEYISHMRDYHSFAQILFFKNGKPDPGKCERAAATLIYENAELAGGFQSHEVDSQLYYHVPYVEKGAVTARGKYNKDSRQRIRNILTDVVSPQKSDLLYLLWFVANNHWIGTEPTPEEKANLMDDFIAAATCLLEAAFLPEFYPPNLLEETLLTALALGDTDHNPAAVYESICSVFTDRGVTKKAPGSTKKTAEEKRRIAAYYYDHLSQYPTKSACKKACADHFKIGVASVEGYCREYPEETLKIEFSK